MHVASPATPPDPANGVQRMYRKENSQSKQEKASTEGRYKYDVRILNMLATVGLKASSIAHEMQNDRNLISDNCASIISALKEYDMWDELESPEKTTYSYKNVPHLLISQEQISKKVLAFMDAMLSDTEKKQFIAGSLDVYESLEKMKKSWELDYSWIRIKITANKRDEFYIAEDVLKVVFDNLILNSIQQNEKKSVLTITIDLLVCENRINLHYYDDGKGLNAKYLSNTRKILEVHETTRKNGHGLGMWIINNTVTMSGGEISKIYNEDGFHIEFSIGDKM